MRRDWAEGQKAACPCEMDLTAPCRDRAGSLRTMGNRSPPTLPRAECPKLLPSHSHLPVMLVADLGVVSSGQAWAPPLAASSHRSAKRLRLERARRLNYCPVLAGQGYSVQGVAQGCTSGAGSRVRGSSTVICSAEDARAFQYTCPPGPEISAPPKPAKPTGVALVAKLQCHSGTKGSPGDPATTGLLAAR